MNCSIMVALVHNNNAQRNSYLRPKIEVMLRTLDENISATAIEVSYQNEVKLHSTAMALMRDAMYRKLDRAWLRYRLLKPRLLARDVAGFIKTSFVKYLIRRDSIGTRWKRNSAIEVIVTDKHIRAWNQFLDSGSDFLVCFEDDVVFKDDSIVRIKGLLEHLGKIDQQMHIYVDLAGGGGRGNIEALKIDKLELNRTDSYRIYKKPVTSTACAYLINRNLASLFNKHLLQAPWLRLVGIDWMMNALFIRSSGEQVLCMHAEPTIFKHGTVTGEYVTWQAEKN